MKLSDFDIDFNKFKNEKDSFKFQLKDTFFELKYNSLFDQAYNEVKEDKKESEKFYVERINIFGNSITQEEFIRNQLIVDDRKY